MLTNTKGFHLLLVSYVRRSADSLLREDHRVGEESGVEAEGTEMSVADSSTGSVYGGLSIGAV